MVSPAMEEGEVVLIEAVVVVASEAAQGAEADLIRPVGVGVTGDSMVATDGDKETGHQIIEIDGTMIDEMTEMIVDEIADQVHLAVHPLETDPRRKLTTKEEEKLSQAGENPQITLVSRQQQLTVVGAHPHLNPPKTMKTNGKQVNQNRQRKMKLVRIMNPWRN